MLTKSFVKPFRLVYANSLDAYIPELWANESVAILVENMVAANLIHRDFSPQVAKFGDIVHTRKPTAFTAVRKLDTDDVTVQNAEATDIQVPLDQHLHTSFMIRDGEESKSFKQLRDEYLQPAVLSIAQAVDKVILGNAAQFMSNAEGKIAGVTTSNIVTYILEARNRMNINKAPMDGRNLILTPNTETLALGASVFHEADKVGDDGTALREASLGRKLGFNTFMCQNASSPTTVVTQTNNPLIDLGAGYAAGSVAVHMDTYGSELVVGDWFTVAGDAVPHQITALANLATNDVDVTFTPALRAAVVDDAVVTVTTSGLVDLTAGYAAGWAKAIEVDTWGDIPLGSIVGFATAGSPNVLHDGYYSIIAKTPATGDTLTITLNRPLTTAVANDDHVFVAPQGEYNFGFHRNAMTMVSRPLAPAPAGLAISSVANFGGVGIRVTMTYNGTSQGTLVTVDLLCGIATLDTALGTVLVT